MNLIEPIDLGSYALQEQLYRYAQDLQDLLHQYSDLQRRHQIMLKALGQGPQDGDLLLNTLLDSANHYFVTDLQGQIVFTSPATVKTLYGSQPQNSADTIMHLMPPHQVIATLELLISLASATHRDAIHQRKLALHASDDGSGVHIFEALLLLGKHQGRSLIYWFLSEETPTNATLQHPLQAFPALQDCAQGVCITDPQGTICAVNAAFSQTTGYSAADILGSNPRRLGAGLQDKAFFQNFWRELLSKGSWSGELFNRRANAAIYFAWMSVKAIVNAAGTTLFYIAIFVDKSPAEDDLHKLSQLAFHDPLTGLPNRILLERRLAQAITKAQDKAAGLYVLIIHLHQLGTFNEEMGRETGELLLQEVAARLQSTLKRGDTVARSAADEFAVILPGIDLRAAAEQTANDLLSEIAKPIHFGQHHLVVGAIIGASAFPDDGKDGTTLLHCADAALFGAKRFGMQVCFYEAAEHLHTTPTP